MDEQLAQIYGTGQSYDEEDIEKTAAAELLVKLAEEEGVNLDQFSDEEIAEMLGELYGEKTAGDEKKEEHEKKETKGEEKKEEEAKEKAAEADFLGRVMAHAMVQELGSIEKEAGIKEKYEAAKGAVGRGASFLKGLPGRYGKNVKERFTEAHRAGKEAVTGKGSIGGGDMSKMDRLKALGHAAKKVAPEAGTAAGLAGAAAVAAHLHGKKKHASAVAELADQRAYEILAQSGWVAEDGSVIEPQVKEASVEQEVELQALRLLEENGYPVEWNQ